jgi:ectoine hydroxylase-related dioxygenase (phytanoyl-CoA dioxygenase family)
MISCRHEDTWLAQVVEALRYVGYEVVTDVFDALELASIREAMFSARDAIHADVGEERLERAGELGVLRLMVGYEPSLLRVLEKPEMLAIVDATVSPTGILHLQNGFILPSFASSTVPVTFQTTFHRDFPRHLYGYLASVNCLLTVDEFTAENGGTLVVPGTHQCAEKPSDAYLTRNALPVEAPPGSLIVFDSSLWHAAGANVSGRDRLGINHQFTRSFIKQQIDYVRALGDDVVEGLPDRTQQLLGWYTRVVTSLDEYYLPPDQRLYRAGQG